MAEHYYDESSLLMSILLRFFSLIFHKIYQTIGTSYVCGGGVRVLEITVYRLDSNMRHTQVYTPKKTKSKRVLRLRLLGGLNSLSQLRPRIRPQDRRRSHSYRKFQITFKTQRFFDCLLWALFSLPGPPGGQHRRTCRHRGQTPPARHPAPALTTWSRHST